MSRRSPSRKSRKIDVSKETEMILIRNSSYLLSYKTLRTAAIDRTAKKTNLAKKKKHENLVT
jgi:hypothetical protein